METTFEKVQEQIALGLRECVVMISQRSKQTAKKQQAKKQPKQKRKSKLWMFVFHDVFTSYTSGIACVIAFSEKDAIKRLVKRAVAVEISRFTGGNQKHSCWTGMGSELSVDWDGVDGQYPILYGNAVRDELKHAVDDKRVERLILKPGSCGFCGGGD